MSTTPCTNESGCKDSRCGGKKRSTSFPILLGILCGLIAFALLAMVETPSFYRLTVFVFDEPSPKLLFAKPAYYCVHRTILLVLTAVGGTVGVWFSEWPKKKSFLFLLAMLLLVATFAAVGFR